MKRRIATGLLAAVLVVFMTPRPVLALEGGLDPSFSSDGYDTRLATGVSDTYDAAYSLEVQSDGKTVAAGATATDDETFAVVRRYSSDGQLDPTFGTDGNGTTAINFSDVDMLSEFEGLALQDDGKIVAVGTVRMDNGAGGSNNNALIARFTADGELDDSFSGDGFAILNTLGNGAATDDRFKDVQVISGDQILVVGVDGTNGVLMRFDDDGTVDTGFGTSGKAVVTGTAGGVRDQFNTLAVQSDGRIVVGGAAWAVSPTRSYMAVWRFLSFGILDTSTFATSGRYLSNGAGGQADGFDRAEDIILDNNNIVVAGLSKFDAFSSIGVVWKLSSSGAPMSAFSGDGIALLAEDQYAEAITGDDDGGYYLAGSSLPSGADNADSAVWKMSATGTLDSDFGVGGMLMLPNFTPYTDEWGAMYDLAYRDNKLYFAGSPFDNGTGSTGYAWVAGRLAIGNEIVNKPAGVTVTDTSGNEITAPIADTQAIRLESSAGRPIVEFDGDFSTGDVDLSGVTVAVSESEGKAVVSGLSGTHTLFVPKLAGNTSVIVCPDATTLAEVVVGCSNQQTYTEASSNVSVVTIDGRQYWRIEGLTGTGGLSLGAAVSAPATGLPAEGPALRLLALASGGWLLLRFSRPWRRAVIK
jgi:uncharacterized delta-60 repeat protein